MKIKDFPKEGRPRERFQKYGAEALSDAELFAIVLRTGTRNKKGEQGENVVDVSNRLIKYRGLNKLFECSLKELQNIKGVGPTKAMQILAMGEISRRYSESKNNIKKISSAREIFKLFHDRLKNEKQEHFMIVMLNNKNFLIGEKIVTKGILDASIIHPREVFKEAIKNSASKLIILHNHPSGDPTPSKEDIEVTKELVKAGKFLGIPIVDHIIIGNGEYWSWQQSST